MAGSGDASVSLDLDAQQLFQELQNVQSHFGQFASKTTQQGEEASKGSVKGFGGLQDALGGVFSGLLAPLAGIFSVVGATHALESAVKSSVEYGAKIQDLSHRFGVGTEELQKFGSVLI